MKNGKLRTGAQAANNVIDGGWGTLNWLANREFTGNQGVTVGRVVIRKGQQNARHRHNNCEEVLYLLQGRLSHTVGDETVTMEPGDTITINAGVFHNGTNIGDTDADMIVVYSTGERDFELEHPSGEGE